MLPMVTSSGRYLSGQESGEDCSFTLRQGCSVCVQHRSYCIAVSHGRAGHRERHSTSNISSPFIWQSTSEVLPWDRVTELCVAQSTLSSEVSEAATITESAQVSSSNPPSKEQPAPYHEVTFRYVAWLGTARKTGDAGTKRSGLRTFRACIPTAQELDDVVTMDMRSSCQDRRQNISNERLEPDTIIRTREQAANRRILLHNLRPRFSRLQVVSSGISHLSPSL